MSNKYIQVEQSLNLRGQASLNGAKNATLPIMASLILTDGVSRLSNVPRSHDVMCMMQLLHNLGARADFIDEHTLEVDTSTLDTFCIDPVIMKKMRASILAMGPLLARFGKADVALPGGCSIGARPINYHLEAFASMGTQITMQDDFLYARASSLKASTIIMDYPSVGTTENVMMAAARTRGITRIVNAALEPEVFDLIAVLRAMGANITIHPAATIEIEGVDELKPVEYAIMYDRLEAGALMLAAAITGGDIYLPQAPAHVMEIFILKLQQMGHTVEVGANGVGVRIKATTSPQAVSLKTGQYPGFPTDLQAPMMAAQCLAEGVSIIEETVFENRMLHVHELSKMGANITSEYNRTIIKGVDQLRGAAVMATDIRASCALVLAGFAAQGTTRMTGLHHWMRGYDSLELTLQSLGGRISIVDCQDAEYQALLGQVNGSGVTASQVC